MLIILIVLFVLSAEVISPLFIAVILTKYNLYQKQKLTLMSSNSINMAWKKKNWSMTKIIAKRHQKFYQGNDQDESCT